MAFPLEREVKLRFASAADARDAVLASGATPLRPRRLQSDTLLDTDAGALTGERCALRIRLDGGRAVLTLKGPPQPSVMKLREELETDVADGPLLLTVFGRLGFRPWFRSQKFREEFTLGDVIIAIDETPIGTFVEVEGTESGIGLAAAALGRSPQDYVIESYRSLFVRHCAQRNLVPGDMLFPGHG